MIKRRGITPRVITPKRILCYDDVSASLITALVTHTYWTHCEEYKNTSNKVNSEIIINERLLQLIKSRMKWSQNVWPFKNKNHFLLTGGVRRQEKLFENIYSIWWAAEISTFTFWSSLLGPLNPKWKYYISDHAFGLIFFHVNFYFQWITFCFVNSLTGSPPVVAPRSCHFRLKI